MRPKLKWSIISVACFIAAGLSWWYGEQIADKNNTPNADPGPAATNEIQSGVPLQPQPLVSIGQNPPSLNTTSDAGARAKSKTSRQLPADDGYILRNTTGSVAELANSDSALLLANALLDTKQPTELRIPQHLRTQGEPAAFIIQATTTIDKIFRARLERAGAQTVSYIPNNALLVRMSAGAANAFARTKSVQAVIPYEPYFKLNSKLLEPAVQQTALKDEQLLNVVTFNDAESPATHLEEAGASILAQSDTPFGPMFTIKPKPDGLVELAQLSDVQQIEPYTRRVPLNDLTRPQLGVSAGSVVETNYLGLTGTNVLVNINDTGVDESHDALNGRVYSVDSQYLSDSGGHGTHVAGTIAGNGALSKTVTNAIGSVTNADFRGMAPGAELFVLPISLTTGPLISDSYLQRKAAETNAFISNNSWAYRERYEYDIAAASWDAAVRDALPHTPGMQPLLPVFAAGNSGFGNEDGSGGEPGSITSPGTAKNVITVGGIDHLRYITNEVVITENGETVTNRVFLQTTDSDNQVMPASSRGNVGVGIEGDFGRFKPDVVAPGAFVISTRSSGYEDPEELVLYDLNRFTDQSIVPGGYNDYSIHVPENASSLEIRILTNSLSPSPMPDLPILLRYGAVPNSQTHDYQTTDTTVTLPDDYELREGDLFYSIGNDTDELVNYDLETWLFREEVPGNYLEVLESLNDGLAPHYRYESGTSMAAPAVSGILALIQEFYEQELNITNSPALMKALMINGSRPVNPRYDLQVRKSLNLQGWGLVNLTNSLPAMATNENTETWPLRFVDQSPTNALETGQRRVWDLELSEDASTQPLRVTLVWTDPPGNPQAAIKLVNNLDLVITNLDTGDFYAGNDIPEGSDFNRLSATNAIVEFDYVNNVENVFIDQPSATNYAVAVIGNKVNVNAVTSQTNRIAQDFALVISTGDLSLTNAITLTQREEPDIQQQPLTVITNGIPVLEQHVGAHLPSLTSTNGVTNQWNFYVFTNTFISNSFSTLTNGTNVAFITFIPPNLSRPRNEEADIDLFVSKNPAITNLEPAAIAAADKSVKRGGTEVIAYTNANIDDVFYVGVKSEDQQAAEYGLVGISSDTPFDQDYNGRRLLTAFPFNIQIPDGSPQDPGGAYMFAVGMFPMRVQRAVVTTTIEHQDFGDITGTLTHNRKFVVLNNHTLPEYTTNNFATLTFDDTFQGDYPGAQPSDGPGSLMDFIGEEGTGLWLISMTDNALNHTGRVNNLQVILDPLPREFIGIPGSVEPNTFTYYYTDVPEAATNLIVRLGNIDPSLPLRLYIRREDPPTLDDYDKMAVIPPQGGSLSLGLNDAPPLEAGRYYIGVFNPNAVRINFNISAELEYLLLAALGEAFSPTNTPIELLDNAITTSTNFVPVDHPITDVRVGLRIKHPRVSDLVLHLVSPQGTRVLLSENRGGLSTNGFGLGETNGEIVYATFSDNTNFHTIPIKFAQPPFTNSAIGETTFVEGWEGASAGVYTNGGTLNGWNVRGDNVRVVTDTNAAIEGTNTLNLLTGAVRRSLPVVADDDYIINFAYRAASDAFPTSQFQVYLEDTLTNIITASTNWRVFAFPFKAFTNGIQTELDGIQGEVFIDNIVLKKKGSVYLPEESLELFKNEPGYGNWKLEIWDNWKGPDTGVTPELIDWQLNFGFAAPGHKAVRLTNAVPYTDTVEGTEIKYFVVETPFRASWATNLLTSTGDVVLLGDWDGLPSGDPVLDDYYIDYFGPGGTEYLLLGTNEPPSAPLQPGQRYYLGVKNANPSETNAFRIMVQFDKLDTTNWLSLITLTNGVSYSSRISTNNWDYYQFNVSSNATFADFELFPANGNVDLYLRKAQPVVNPLPTVLNHDYRSINQGTADETITVYTNSAISPFPLTPGTWYLGVRRMTTNAVDYTIRATESTGPSAQIIDLTNNIPFNFTVPVEQEPSTVFRFNIANANPAVVFAIDNLSGNADLVLRRNAPPSSTLFNTGSFRFGTNSERIVVRTNNNLFADLYYADLNGDWYLAVLNNEATNVTGSITAFAAPPEPQINNLTNNVPYSGSITGAQMKVFAVDVPEFTISATNTLTSSANVVLFGDRDNPPVGNAFIDDYYMNTNSAGGTEVLLLTTNYPAQAPLTSPGRYYLGVMNRDLGAVNDFTIQVDFNTIEVRFLRDRTPITNSIPAGEDLQYYRYTVPPIVTHVEFGLTNLSGNADLLARTNTPLPTPSDYHLAGANGGATNEWITITNGMPVWAPPETWYFGVVNNETNTVDYSIVAREYFPSNSVIELTNNIPYTTSTTNALDYYKFNVSTGATWTAFQVFDSDADVDLLVRKKPGLPTPRNVDYQSAAPGTGNEWIVITENSSPVPLTPGTWYVAAHTPDTNAVTYSIVASEFTGPISQLIQLTNAVTYTNTLSATNGLDYYWFEVATMADQAVFELLQPDGNADLFIKHGFPMPDTNVFDHAGTNTGTADELIDITTTTTPNPLEPGIYLLSVANADTNTVNYGIRATEYYPMPRSNVVIYPDVSISNGVFHLVWNSTPGTEYIVRSRTNLADPTWNILTNIVAVSDQTSYEHPSSSGLQFFSVISPAAPVNVVDLTNNVPVDATTPPGSVIDTIYRFNVTDQDATALFELFNLDGNADLVLRKASHPTRFTFDSTAPLPGTQAESIKVSTNAPASIVTNNTAGEWYLAVLNRERTPVNFTIMASLPEPAPQTNLIISPNLTPSQDGIVLSWQSASGMVYRVEGKVNLEDQGWNIVVSNLPATPPTNSFTVPFSNTNNFFRIGQSLAEPQEPPPSTNLVTSPNLTPSQDGIVLSWQSASGMVYRVEGKVNLEDQGWNIVVSNLPAAPPTNSFTVPFSNTNNFFRIGQSLAEPQEPPPSTNLVTYPNLTPSQDGIVLSWQSTSGIVYRVEGKVNLEDQGWNIVASNLPATPPTNYFTVQFSNTNNFFRIGQQTAQSKLTINPTLNPDDTISLSWPATPGEGYEVLISSNLIDWTTLTTITATGTTGIFKDVQATNAHVRFYRIKVSP